MKGQLKKILLDHCEKNHRSGKVSSCESLNVYGIITLIICKITILWYFLGVNHILYAVTHYNQKSNIIHYNYRFACLHVWMCECENV